MADGGVTQIDAGYLNTLKANLQTILGEVNTQLTGIGSTGVTASTTNYIYPVDDTLVVMAGPGSFDAATVLNTKLKAMGGSVHTQLVWLAKVLTDMISEITTTVSKFSDAESLNNEAVSQLITDFQNTIGDMNNPGSSQSNPNTSTGT